MPRYEGMQGASARRGDVEVYGQASIRVDFMARERQDGARGFAFAEAGHRCEEGPRVGCHLFDVPISRDDHDDEVMQRGRCHVQRLGSRRQARHVPVGYAEPGAAGRGLEDCAKGQGGRSRHNGTDSRSGNLTFYRLIFSMIALVEYPLSTGIRTTRPPRATIVSRPTI